MTGTGSVCTKGTQSYMGEQIHLCGFLLLQYKINKDEKSTIYQIISLLAHNSQNYQNQKSLELEIVVRRVVFVFFTVLLLFIC